MLFEKISIEELLQQACRSLSKIQDCSGEVIKRVRYLEDPWNEQTIKDDSQGDL